MPFLSKVGAMPQPKAKKQPKQRPGQKPLSGRSRAQPKGITIEVRTSPQAQHEPADHSRIRSHDTTQKQHGTTRHNGVTSGKREKILGFVFCFLGRKRHQDPRGNKVESVQTLRTWSFDRFFRP
eukprot:CAMPEP_0198117688 /NCGR_PEP_ID=MMETSP1442-20131203/18969_1 /TAXON_ID= /ORGANISM="Craspedostauros australis, Strain CCMP3328" /LENGTH=123 /DNA_ID=CAMNT_0043775797 /DNA_START=79 /DNA_END=450 /DNA_ORIENTATION=+